MKVLAINGSPRPEGNTKTAIDIMFEIFDKNRISTELIQLNNKTINGCIACYKCYENKNGRCISQKNDDANLIIEKMQQADAIIIGSPVYFGTMTAKTKALIERAGLVAKANDDMLKGKIGSSLVIARRAGASFTFAAMNFFFFSSQMILPGSAHWNMCYGKNPGDIKKDSEGMQVIATLAENIISLLKMRDVK